MCPIGEGKCLITAESIAAFSMQTGADWKAAV